MNRENLHANVLVDANLLRLLIRRVLEVSAPPPTALAEVLAYYDTQASKALDREVKRLAAIASVAPEKRSARSDDSLRAALAGEIANPDLIGDALRGEGV